MRMGLEAAGWRVHYANDIDRKKYEQYRAHFRDADAHFEVEDVNLLDASGIPPTTLATASFPCTDLSVAGERRGIREGESSAFWGFVRVLREMGACRPPIVLLENVVGFLTSHAGRDFVDAMAALNGLGYAVDPFILDAKWFVPQSRARLFVVASMQAHQADPEPVQVSRLRPPALRGVVVGHPEIRWACRTLADPPEASDRKLMDVLDDLPHDSGEWWPSDRVDYLAAQMSVRHRLIVDESIRKRRWSFGTVFRRVRRQPDGEKRSMAELRVDGIAGCLRTPKGGSGRQILVKMGYGKLRARLLTPAECARLMGADGFAVSGSDNDALFAFGDAVCVPAVTWIAHNYLNPLAAELGITHAVGARKVKAG